MNLKRILAATLCAASIIGAFAADPVAEKILAERRATLEGVDFSVFDRTDLTPEQRDYLTFLYAYMALPDITDHDGQYFLDNVNVALRARNEMAWGKKVPEREFRHFVVPLRINDEPLDNHRAVFYEELRDRVKDLPAKEAILEINHWCHEKATYQPADGRTRGPLQTCYSAIGRCGEESTFTVAALRTMGIPARQVYTPRWAHTDDNHAWVEAYADGKWYFLGACEPEPVLNLGWFNAPASRGILMETRLLGPYNGPEEQLISAPDYTDINVTSNYAPTAKMSVNVVNADGTPADSANVAFCVYNYGEFYPLTSRTFRASDKKPVTLSAGLGDVLVWASDGNHFGFTTYTVGSTKKPVTVTLSNNNYKGEVKEFTLTPPAGRNNLPPVTPEQAAFNDLRKAKEDSIRGLYTATFATPADIEAAVTLTGLDSARVARVLTDARGNWRPLVDLLAESHDRTRALRLLEVISMKDRGDAPAEVLESELSYPATLSPLYDQYILNPRVYNEQLAPNHDVFHRAFTKEQIREFKADPAKWVNWVAQNIDASQQWNPERVRMSADGVLRTRTTSEASRDIFFVTGARVFGIPARLDPISGKTQWADARGNWNDATFDAKAASAETSTNAPTGKLQLKFEPVGRIDDPKYYSQFTISRIVDGQPVLLGFNDFAPFSETFGHPIDLDCGEYMLVTGQRMADGSVLARTTFFTINEGATTPVDLVIRQDNSGVQVIGNFDAESLYLPDGESSPRSVLSTTGRGFYVLGVVSPRSEPSVHAFNDIAAIAPEFDAAGLPLVIITENDPELIKRAMADAGKMPEKTFIGSDINGKIAETLVNDLKLTPSSLPIFIIADTFNRVVFVSQGYTISLGDQLLDVIHKLEK